MTAPGLLFLLVMDSVTAEVILSTAEGELCFLVAEVTVAQEAAAVIFGTVKEELCLLLVKEELA